MKRSNMKLTASLVVDDVQLKSRIEVGASRLLLAAEKLCDINSITEKLQEFAHDDDDEDDSDKEAFYDPSRSLPASVTLVLKKWFVKHSDNPYPSKDEKEKLIAQTGLNNIVRVTIYDISPEPNIAQQQLRNWFSNLR